jgi:adhesin/invasin
MTLLLLIAAIIISGCQKGHTPSPPTGDAQRASINLSASVASVVADGVSTITFTAQVYSNTNVLAADGTEVDFTTNLGTFAATATTTVTATTTSGIATATLTSSTTTGKAYVQAQSSALSVTATGSVSFIAGALTTVTISSPTTQISADGTSTTTITASLYDANSNLVKTSTSVAFATTAGTLSSAAVTTTSGTASVILTSSTTVETATITATVGAIAPVTVDVGFVVVVANYTITLQPSPSTIQANGNSTSSITALLMDSNNNPLEDQTISFSTTVGTITALATTNDSGVATATLTSVREEATAIITATYGSISETINVRITGISLTIEANPKSILSNGTSTSTITVTLKDASDIEIQAETITLTDTSVLGLTFTPATGITDINGQFTATVSSATAGDGIITATGAGASASDTVTFTAFVFDVTTDAGTVETCDGTTEYVTVTATMTETGVGGVAGQTVNLYSTHGGFTTTLVAVTCNATPTSTITATDNGDGTYTAYFWGQETTGTATITAQATYNNTDLEDSATVTITATTPANITLSAAPNRIAYSGNTSTITALVTDTIGNPVTNKLVSFQVTNGPGTESLIPTTSLTDADGKATSTFTSGSLGSSFEGVTVEGSVQGAGGTISGNVKLTITGPPSYVAVGSANTLIDDIDGLFKQYIIVTVKDIYGNDVADGTAVTLGVREVGFYTQDYTYYNAEDTNENGMLDCEDADYDCVLDLPDEDLNENLLLDCEDGSTGYPKNGRLDPQSTAVIPSVATTSGGIASVLLEYAQSDACWIRIRIDAASGGVTANPLTKDLETTVVIGCPQPKYHSNINPAGSDLLSTFTYSITNGSSAPLSISDFSSNWEYTWKLSDFAADGSAIDGGAGPVSGVGLNSVIYTAPNIGSGAGTDTVTVEDCMGSIKIINIAFDD